jgi:hypothetical protein
LQGTTTGQRPWESQVQLIRDKSYGGPTQFGMGAHLCRVSSALQRPQAHAIKFGRPRGMGGLDIGNQGFTLRVMVGLPKTIREDKLGWKLGGGRRIYAQ